MPKIAEIKVNDAFPIFTDLDLFFARESQSLPVAFVVSKGKVTVGLNKHVTYSAHVDASDTLPMSMTVLYSPVCAFFTEGQDIELHAEQNGLVIKTGDISILYASAYSSVEPIDTSGYSWSPMVNASSAAVGLTTLTSSGLSAYYKRDVSVKVYGDVSEMYYGNVVIQCRTPGLPENMVLSAANCKLFSKFRADSFHKTEAWLFLKRGSAVLALPYTQMSDTNDVVSIISSMGPPLTLTPVYYSERIAAISKMKFLRVSLTFYKEGMVTRAVDAMSDISIPLGEIDDTPLATFMVPSSLWLICMKLLKSRMFQILYNKEGLICLRTNEEIILLHAIC